MSDPIGQGASVLEWSDRTPAMRADEGPLEADSGSKLETGHSNWWCVGGAVPVRDDLNRREL